MDNKPAEIVRLMTLSGYSSIRDADAIAKLSDHDLTALLRHAQYYVRLFRHNETQHILSYHNVDYPAIIDMHLRPEALLAMTPEFCNRFLLPPHEELHFRSALPAIQADVRDMLEALSYTKEEQPTQPDTDGTEDDDSMLTSSSSLFSPSLSTSASTTDDEHEHEHELGLRPETEHTHTHGMFTFGSDLPDYQEFERL